MVKPRVLILCTANSARSQMAEGILRWLSGGQVEAHSAGMRPSRVNPFAIRAMQEIGVDISNQRSKGVEEFLGQPFDYVITVCDDAAESCPTFPGPARRIHWSFPDPAAVEDETERMTAFRDVRDGLIQRFRSFLQEIGIQAAA
ncbi:MAG: arsenate reductase ArsC [Thermoflexales bacterium]|nr:arsenate reductase ArsC [Thermoflexales bacterium]MCX7938891.1 arsenate reductase ArsC [Thermoflexales bacterium]MDW8292314.1 arsenate reductase ArsC [Anaerolineae bacterium]